MDTLPTDRKLREILAQVLKDRPDNIGEETSQDTHANWDSLSHLNLVMSLEAEFGIVLDAEEILGMRSLADMKEVLEKKGVTD